MITIQRIYNKPSKWYLQTNLNPFKKAQNYLFNFHCNIHDKVYLISNRTSRYKLSTISTYVIFKYLFSVPTVNVHYASLNYEQTIIKSKINNRTELFCHATSNFYTKKPLQIHDQTYFYLEAWISCTCV